MTRSNIAAHRSRLPLVALAITAVFATGCDKYGDRKRKAAEAKIEQAGDDKAAAIGGAASILFIEGFYDTKVEVKGTDALDAIVTLTRNEKNYIPADMATYRDNHLADQGVELLQTATVAKPLGLRSISVTIRTDVEAAGGVVDMLVLDCPVDAILAAAPSGLDPFASTMGGDWAEELVTAGPLISAACTLTDNTGDFVVVDALGRS